MYLAILMICTTPHIGSCQLIQHPTIYEELEQCQQSVFLGSQEFQGQNYFTLGRCIKVPMKTI